MNCLPMCSTLTVSDDCADLPRCPQRITNPSGAFLRNHTPNRGWRNPQPVIVGLIKDSRPLYFSPKSPSLFTSPRLFQKQTNHCEHSMEQVIHLLTCINWGFAGFAMSNPKVISRSSYGARFFFQQATKGWF